QLTLQLEPIHCFARAQAKSSRHGLDAIVDMAVRGSARGGRFRSHASNIKKLTPPWPPAKTNHDASVVKRISGVHYADGRNCTHILNIVLYTVKCYAFCSSGETLCHPLYLPVSQ